MTFADPLSHIQRIGLDAAPLIYFFEQHQSYHQRMLRIMKKIDQGFMQGVVSTIVLTEILYYPLKLGHTTLAHHYTTLLSTSTSFNMVAVDPIIAYRAAALRTMYALRTPDAIHLATAIEASCDAFLTNDKQLKRVQDIQILLLDDLI